MMMLGGSQDDMEAQKRQTQSLEEDKENDEPANVDAAKILLIVLSFQRVWRGELLDNQISNTALITLKAVSSSLTGSLLWTLYSSVGRDSNNISSLELDNRVGRRGLT